MTSRHNKIAILLRVFSGALALIAFAISGIRGYGYLVAGPQWGAEGGIIILGIFFPLSLGLIFGYLAVKGKFPFTRKHIEKIDQ